MRMPQIPKPLANFLRQQQLYLGVAAAIYAILWAIGQSPNVGIILVYSLSDDATLIVLDALGGQRVRQKLYEIEEVSAA
jgi:hypothetical protein